MLRSLNPALKERIEVSYFLGDEKHPLTGEHALTVLTNVLYEALVKTEPLRATDDNPVIAQAQRIKRRINAAIDEEAEERMLSARSSKYRR